MSPIPSRFIIAIISVTLAAAPVRQVVAQALYPGYGVGFGFSQGNIVSNPRPRDLFNGATVATPGAFMDRFRQPDGTSGSITCGSYGNGPALYGQEGRDVRTFQSDRRGMFHDRFANLRPPDPAEPTPGGGSGLAANAVPSTYCR